MMIRTILLFDLEILLAINRMYSHILESQDISRQRHVPIGEMRAPPQGPPSALAAIYVQV